jgi:hypothetical protein
MPDGIECKIEECHHNNTGKCLAANIEVRSSVDDKVCHMSENTCLKLLNPKCLNL